MKNEPTKKPATKQDKPHCRKCGATDIAFTYTEMMHGRKIDEKTALRSACYYLGELLSSEATSQHGFDPNTLSNMSITMVELSAMVVIRDASDRKDREEAQS